MTSISRPSIARRLAACGAFMFASIFGIAGAQAQSLADFYKGKQISVIIYSAAGSAYDVYARLLARHMGRHIPGNPGFLPKQMPGAGGLKATEYLYRFAPKDGTVFGTISRGNPFEPILGNTKANFDPFKMVWLGSMNREVSLAISWHTAKVKTFDDLKKTELLIPGTGAGADSQILPVAFNNLAGTKFKIILGYPNTTKAALSMEQGELDGIGYWSWSAIKQGHPDWIKDKKINLLLHTGLKAHPELPGVKLIREAATTEIDKKALEFILAREILGRPFVAPPDLPADRAGALRQAFAASLKDAELLKDAERSRMEIDLVTGEEVDALLKTVSGTPADVLARVKQVLGRK
jgi:tripartite-type tricarboxylate transporter receptor subunit TctC